MLGFGTEAVTRTVGLVVAAAQNGLEVLRYGGLDTGEEPSPYEVVERSPMFRLRHYFPDSADTEDRPVIVLVPPMMVAADVYDVSPASSAVSTLHESGLDPWVVDFGAPDREAGGLDRTLADHVVAVSEVVGLVRAHTGRDVHLAGYSQGGMFCYQAAAYRRGKQIASVVTFGAPADPLAGAPLGLSETALTTSADFLAKHVFSRLGLPGWAARTAFRLLDPVKAARSRLEFLLQLHNREALLGKEKQRRFIENEGWIAWSGPAIVDLLQQFVVHNRMLVGGFSIDEQLVTLADLTCPILAFVGEADNIGQPAAVRGIGRAAPRAEVYEFPVRAGHFGLVVGSAAMTSTWPAVASWVLWREGRGDRPEKAHRLDELLGEATGAAVGLTRRASQLAEAGFSLAWQTLETAAGFARTGKEITGEAVHILPRLARLGQVQSHTRISLGKMLDEQAQRAPQNGCFLFDDRVHTNAAVAQRIDNVVRGLIHAGVRQGARIGVLMETRPSALVAIAALSRLGAVAVMLPPADDLRTLIRLGDVSEVIVDPQHAAQAANTGARVLVLGGGSDDRNLTGELGLDDAGVVDLERIDPAAVALPAWYQPNPGTAQDLAFVVFSRSGENTEAKLITNHRWALSAFGTASAAALDDGDTVYCLTPLHHPSALLTSVGGAVAGGSRIALTRGFDPDRFTEEVHRYGVTVVSYTWTSLRELLTRPAPPGSAHHPVRLFMGSGMPRSLWRHVAHRFAPAKVLEFYAATEGDAVLANLTGAKAGAKGRPLPGSAKVELARFDPATGRLVEDARGFAMPCDEGEAGLLLARPRASSAPAGRALRSVFTTGDTWVPTDDLFRRDSDGDFWLVDNRHTVINTERGPVFTQPICDALADVQAVDLAIVYAVRAEHGELAVAAITRWKDSEITAASLDDALAAVPPEQRPDIVHVVDEIPVTAWYRPKPAELREAGLPTHGWRLGPDGYVELNESDFTSSAATFTGRDS